MQNTEREDMYALLRKAWKEDPNLTLKIIFHLRDVRNGMGAIAQFHVGFLKFIIFINSQTLMGLSF